METQGSAVELTLGLAWLFTAACAAGCLRSKRNPETGNKFMWFTCGVYGLLFPLVALLVLAVVVTDRFSAPIEED